MDHDFWRARGYTWNEKTQCYEPAAKKTERKNPHVFSLPERAGAIIQEPAANRKRGKGKVHPKGRARKVGRDGVEVERFIIANFKYPNYKRRDVDGSNVTILDQLVHAGIIPDDSVSHVQREFAGFTISEVPGVEIIIIEYE